MLTREALGDRLVIVMALSERRTRFAIEYCVDFNATQAALRAGYASNGAGQKGHDLLKSVEIQAAIAARKAELAVVAGITKESVLNEWWAIATADPNEIIQHRRVNCRYCWGIDFKAQWTVAEYEAALNRTMNTKEPQDAPELEGGLGFDGTRTPHPDCPECFGEGKESVYLADTRTLRGPARRLYAGVKQTATGIEVKFRDQDKAWENISKFLGMPIDRKELSAPGGVPIAFSMNPDDLTDEQLAMIASRRAYTGTGSDGSSDTSGG